MPSCSVPYCQNTSGKGKDARLTFHPFPHETPLFLKKWLENIGRPNWHPGHRSVVCCAHFEKDDFDRQGRLRIGSFPVKFPESPFRKKTKLETNTGADGKSLTVCLNPGILSKAMIPILSPVVKQAPSTIKKFFKVNEPSQRVISVENDSSLVEVASDDGNDSVSQGSGSNENRVEMKPDPTDSSVTKIPEVSKRKILEESQPTAVTSGVALGSSYSLRGCRICGTVNNSNVNIFGQEGENLSLAELLKKCHLQVSESESLPHYVCRQCIPRLKTTHELMTSWEKNRCSLGAKDTKRLEEADPPVIHSKPIQPQPASRGNRRVLLLEMGLREGIPVKSMIAQAIQELTLRLKPKESRESKPEGRIMFLDLQGGKEAFPEQMKKAISMLFPSGEKKLQPTTPRRVPTLAPKAIVPTVSGISTSTTGGQKLQTNASVPTEGKSSSSSPVKQIMHPKPASSNASANAMSTTISSKQLGQSVPAINTSLLKKPPVQAKVASQASSSATTATPPALRPLARKTAESGSSVNQNIIVETSPGFSPVPLAIKPSGTSSAIRIATTAGAPQVVQMPSLNYMNIHPNSVTANKAKDEAMVQPELDDDYHNYEEFPSELESSIQSENNDVPPLVPIKQVSVSNEKSPVATTSALPVINISKMRETVVSKINHMPKQIKLGDKIVGIVVRNSNSNTDVKKKLQATFSAKTPTFKDNKQKERPILPKGGVTIIGVKSISSTEMEGGKKVKPKVLDIASAVDLPTEYSERRNARRLSLSYMWRKTGFLVSSYQKLFTWRVGTNDNAMPVLTCRVCNFIPKSKQEVESHLSTHPDLQCPICSKYFLKDTKVFEHMTVIHGTPQPASHVPKKKPHISWRINAVKRPPLRQYQCSRCDKRFKLKYSLQRHLTVCKERTATDRGIGATSSDSCAVCSRSFTSQEELQEHMLIHMKRTSWLCDICGLVLKSASNYRTHIARHDELAHEYQYQCHICKKRFKLTNRFQDHMKKHEMQQKYICSSCGKSFNTLSGLRQHEILHGERKLQCKYCPSRFHRRDHLRIHENSHLKPKPARTADGKIVPGTGRMFTCRFCVSNSNSIVRFPNMRELMKHYSDDHAYERGSIPAAKKYDCDRCNKSFVNTTLLRHHHMWHAGLRPYNCAVCGAGFMIKERLRNHEMTHTNERPYKCHTCGKSFRSRNVLKQHKVIHNDPSEFYKCQYCDKTFSRIDNLRTHTRVHTGEKPWKCLHCNRQFRLRSECTKHIQIAHQIPLEEVGACIETLLDPLSAVSSESESAIAAIAGITTVQDMELLIEDDDVEECDEDEDPLQ